MARILVVEDEPMVMDMTTELLQTLGHEVLQAERGDEALRALAASQGTDIDFVLLDLSLPDIDGIELLPKILPYVGDHKIIVCSGDISAIAEVKTAYSGIHFLAKPFSLHLLEQAIEQSLKAS